MPTPNLSGAQREVRKRGLDLLDEAHRYVLERLPEPADREPMSMEEMREFYESWTPEVVDKLAQQAGHQDGEETPCDLCAFIGMMETLKRRREGTPPASTEMGAVYG